MTDILVAFSSTDPIGADIWARFTEALDDPARERFTLRTPLAVWRARGDGLPEIAVHERVYLVLDGITRGYVPLLKPPLLSQDGAGRVIKLRVDLRRFHPCQLEWRWPSRFHRSWRYVRFTEACLLPFPAWRTVSPIRKREPWVPDVWQQLAAAEAVAR